MKSFNEFMAEARAARPKNLTKTNVKKLKPKHMVTVGDKGSLTAGLMSFGSYTIMDDGEVEVVVRDTEGNERKVNTKTHNITFK